MNISNTSTKYPLHVAVAMDNITYLQALLAEGTLYDIDARDDLNLTPLQVACYLGHTEIAAFLISKGADVSLHGGYCQNFSALSLAAFQGHTDIVKLLIQDQSPEVIDSMHLETVLLYGLEGLFNSLEAGQDSAQFENSLDIFLTLVQAQTDAQELPLLYFEEGFVPSACGFFEPASVWLEALAKYATTKESYDRIMSEVVSINEHDTCYQTYIEAKLLLHVLPVDDSYYTITYQSKDGVSIESGINCHGFMHCFVTPFVAREMDAYRSNLELTKPFMLETFDDLSNIYHRATDFIEQPAIYQNSILAYQLYQAGETLLLPSGWEGHAINVILDPKTDYFIVANAGERYLGFMPGAHIYQMNHPEHVTPELIFDILNNTDQMHLEFTMKYQLVLDEVDYLEHADQEYGNCAFYSHKPAIESLLYLHHLHEGLDSYSAKSLAHAHYTDWQTYETFHCLENYFDHNPTLNIDAVLDILIDYHPSLFTDSESEINMDEYHQAEYLVKVLARDQYRDDFYDHFASELEYAKPELIDLFESVNLLTIPELLPTPANDSPLYFADNSHNSVLDAFSLVATQAI